MVNTQKKLIWRSANSIFGKMSGPQKGVKNNCYYNHPSYESQA